VHRRAASAPPAASRCHSSHVNELSASFGETIEVRRSRCGKPSSKTAGLMTTQRSPRMLIFSTLHLDLGRLRRPFLLWCACRTSPMTDVSRPASPPFTDAIDAARTRGCPGPNCLRGPLPSGIDRQSYSASFVFSAMNSAVEDTPPLAPLAVQPPKRGHATTPMSKIDSSVLWGPRVFGRENLGNGRWACVIEAPFDMPAHAPDLMGIRVCLDNSEFEVRGIVSKMPPGPILAGELLELLVVSATRAPAKASSIDDQAS
jgi:hypothetical protein